MELNSTLHEEGSRNAYNRSLMCLDTFRNTVALTHTVLLLGAILQANREQNEMGDVQNVQIRGQMLDYSGVNRVYYWNELRCYNESIDVHTK